MKKLVKNGLMFLAGILVLTTSCTQNDSDGVGGGKGTLSLLLTDAPFPSGLVDHTLVTFDKIEIRSTAVSTSTVTTTEGGNDAQFIVLYEGEGKEFDLLDLQNGLTTELLNMDIPAGSYDFIRMHIAESKVIMKDGAIFDMKIPSGASSGLKIKITPNLVIESGVESEVLLDFDVSKSFIAQGNIKSPHGIKGFLFKPVLRAACQKYSGIITGKVSVNPATPIAEAHVQILRADTVYSSALTDATGVYALVGLPSGDYKMICEKDGYPVVSINQVIVKARETTIVDITMGTTTSTTTTTNTTTTNP